MIEELGNFLVMDGDGPYVWSAYGITLAAMLWNFWSAARLHRQNLDRARRRGGRQQEAAARTPKVRQVQ